MHRSVLQSKKYIEFANDNTVEVISMSSLEQGIERGDRKAATYKAEDERGEVEYLVEFPGLTVEDMLALRRSPAGRYNDTGRIPYTAIVDPHTLEKVKFWSGGQSAKTIMKAVEEVRRELEQEHGDGIRRKDWREVTVHAPKEIREALEEGDFREALGTLEKLEKEYEDAAEALREKLAALSNDTLHHIDGVLGELSRRIDQGDKKALRELRPLARALRGTELEAKAEELLERGKRP